VAVSGCRLLDARADQFGTAYRQRSAGVDPIFIGQVSPCAEYIEKRLFRKPERGNQYQLDSLGGMMLQLADGCHPKSCNRVQRLTAYAFSRYAISHASLCPIPMCSQLDFSSGHGGNFDEIPAQHILSTRGRSALHL